MISLSDEQVKQCSLDHQDRQSFWRLCSLGLLFYILFLCERKKERKRRWGRFSWECVCLWVRNFSRKNKSTFIEEAISSIGWKQAAHLLNRLYFQLLLPNESPTPFACVPLLIPNIPNYASWPSLGIFVSSKAAFVRGGAKLLWDAPQPCEFLFRSGTMMVCFVSSKSCSLPDRWHILHMWV